MKNQPQNSKKKTAILLGCYFLALIFLYCILTTQAYVADFSVNSFREFMFPFCALTSVVQLLVINNKKINFIMILLLQAVGTLWECAQCFLVLPLVCCLWLLKWAEGAQIKDKAAVVGINLFAAILGVMANVTKVNHYGLLPFSVKQVPFAALAGLCLVFAGLAVLLPEKKAAKKKKEQAYSESMLVWLVFFNTLILANTIWHYAADSVDELFHTFSISFWFIYVLCCAYLYVCQNPDSAVIKKVKKIL
ncbi:MAG: hypothetical protein IKE65_05370 [Clostridia bacterium]|nr:hypothetical protein [Clostridia bacterium]